MTTRNLGMKKGLPATIARTCRLDDDGKDILNDELSKSIFYLDDCDYDDDVCTENNYNTVVDHLPNHFYEVRTSLVSQLMTTIPFCVHVPNLSINHRIKSLI